MAKRGKKHNEIVTNDITHAVYTLLMEGIRTHEMYDIIHAEFDISKRAVDSHIAEAKVLIKKEADKYLENAFGEVINKIETVYNMSINDGDKKNANAALANLIKVTGLDKKTIDITSGNQPLTGMTFEIITNIPTE